MQGRSDTLWQMVLTGAVTRVKLILLLILVKLSTVGYYPFWTEDVLLENKCVGEHSFHFKLQNAFGSTF